MNIFHETDSRDRDPTRPSAKRAEDLPKILKGSDHLKSAGIESWETLMLKESLNTKYGATYRHCGAILPPH